MLGQPAGSHASDRIRQYQFRIAASDDAVERLAPEILRHEQGAVAPGQDPGPGTDLAGQLAELPGRRRLPDPGPEDQEIGLLQQLADDDPIRRTDQAGGDGDDARVGEPPAQKATTEANSACQ